MDGIGRLFASMEASASGLQAERKRMDVVAQNIANAQTTSGPDGLPYRRRVVEFEPILRQAENGTREPAGVRVRAVREDMSTPFKRVYDPSHPDRDESGFVRMPNVNVTAEMADLITAVRAYEANLTVQESFVQMAERALRIAQ